MAATAAAGRTDSDGRPRLRRCGAGLRGSRNCGEAVGRQGRGEEEPVGPVRAVGFEAGEAPGVVLLRPARGRAARREGEG